MTVTNASGSNVSDLTASQTAALEAAFSIAAAPGNTNDGAIDWTYNPHGTALLMPDSSGRMIYDHVLCEL